MAFITGKFDGQTYKVPLLPELRGATRELLEFYAEHAVRSAKGQGTAGGGGSIIITDIPLSTWNLKNPEGATTKVQLPKTASVGGMAKSKESLALAKLLAQGQYEAAQAAKKAGFLGAVGDSVEAFGRSALGEGKQLLTGLQQQVNRPLFLDDPAKIDELQRESNEQQVKLDAISDKNPVSSFLGSMVPYFAPLGLGPAARGLGLASKVSQGANVAMASAPKGVKALGVTATNPLIAATGIGAAEGTVHPQQDALSGAVFGLGGNMVGRHIAKWTPFEKRSIGVPSPETKAITDYLERWGGVSQPWMLTGVPSDVGKLYKDRLTPEQVDDYIAKDLPKNQAALGLGLLDEVNTIVGNKVDPVKNAIIEGKLTRETFHPLKAAFSSQSDKAKADEIARRRTLNEARAQEAQALKDNQGSVGDFIERATKAQHSFNAASQRVDTFINSSEIVDALSRSIKDGKIDPEKLSTNLSGFEVLRKEGLEEGVKDPDIQRLRDLIGKTLPTKNVAEHLVDMKKTFAGATELKDPKILGGFDELFRDWERLGLGKYRLPQGTLGNIGTSLGASSSIGVGDPREYPSRLKAVGVDILSDAFTEGARKAGKQ